MGMKTGNLNLDSSHVQVERLNLRRLGVVSVSKIMARLASRLQETVTYYPMALYLLHFGVDHCLH